MVTEELQDKHQYLKRSCMNCKGLDHCNIKVAIQHPTLPHSNCAKYGCRAYYGEYDNEVPMTVDERAKLLKEKRQRELAELTAKTNKKRLL